MNRQAVEPAKPSVVRHHTSLWWLVISPSVWAIHFLTCYLVVAIHCAKSAAEQGAGDDAMATLRLVVFTFTACALLGIAWVGWKSFHRHRLGEASLPHDFDSDDDQHRFIGFASFLLSLLSAIATMYTATVFVFLEGCH